MDNTEIVLHQIMEQCKKTDAQSLDSLFEKLSDPDFLSGLDFSAGIDAKQLSGHRIGNIFHSGFIECLFDHGHLGKIHKAASLYLILYCKIALITEF